MTNKRIRKKQLKKNAKNLGEEPTQTVNEVLSVYVDTKTFDSKNDFTTYLNSLVNDSK